MRKHYWIVCWLEKWWDDGTVKGFKTAVHCETLSEAVAITQFELRIRSTANKTECIITSAGMADDDAADLVGKAETDTLSIDWPD